MVFESSRAAPVRVGWGGVREVLRKHLMRCNPCVYAVFKSFVEVLRGDV